MVAFSLPILIFGASFASAKFTAPSQSSAHTNTKSVPAGFAPLRAADAGHVLDMRVRLAQGDPDGLRDALMAVSTPGNPRYGKHLSKEEVAAFTRPSASTTQAVLSFFASHNLNATISSSSGDWLRVRVPARTANALFAADYRVFAHQASGRELVRTLDYRMPEELGEHVRLIWPGSSFFSARSLPIKTSSTVISSAGSHKNTGNKKRDLSSIYARLQSASTLADVLDALNSTFGNALPALEPGAARVYGQLSDIAHSSTPTASEKTFNVTSFSSTSNFHDGGGHHHNHERPMDGGFDLPGLPDLGDLDLSALPDWLRRLLEEIFKHLGGGGGGGNPGNGGGGDEPAPPAPAPEPIPTGMPEPLPTEMPEPLPTGVPRPPGGGGGEDPLPVPTDIPTEPLPTDVPTEPLPLPTDVPTDPLPLPTDVPTEPLPVPTDIPTEPLPTDIPTPLPTDVPTELPLPTDVPTELPAPIPTEEPIPSPIPTSDPAPSPIPTEDPAPSPIPTSDPTPPSEPPSTGTPDADCSKFVSPKCLQQLYGIPTAPATQASNKLLVTGYIGQYAQTSDLKAFLEQFRPDIDSSTTFEEQTLDGGVNPQSNQQAGVEANLDVQYTIGIATGVPTTFISVGDDGPQDGFLDTITTLLDADAPPQVMTTSYGEGEEDAGPELADALCNAYMQLGARGVSILFASGDSGVGDAQGQCRDKFAPTFPSGCPYITSVGSTQGFAPETAADFSSGGFSNTFDMPDYQSAAVSQYLSQLGDKYSGKFNPKGRAFPDVATQGVNFAVVNAGETIGVQGTSASSPLFASMIALVNDELAAAGKPPLGFLNPWLYSEAANAFVDVTSGSNPGCGTEGFEALPGWDPVTGLGTPSYAALRKAAGLA